VGLKLEALMSVSVYSVLSCVGSGLVTAELPFREYYRLPIRLRNWSEQSVSQMPYAPERAAGNISK
jgi:hypothetical protein